MSELDPRRQALCTRNCRQLKGGSCFQGQEIRRIYRNHQACWKITCRERKCKWADLLQNSWFWFYFGEPRFWTGKGEIDWGSIGESRIKRENLKSQVDSSQNPAWKGKGPLRWACQADGYKKASQEWTWRTHQPVGKRAQAISDREKAKNRLLAQEIRLERANHH